MKLSRVFAVLIGAVLLTAAGIASASTPQSQVMFAPGQPVTLTGATVAAPGATSPGGVVIDTVSTITNGYLLQIKNNGVTKATIDYSGAFSPAFGGSSAVTMARTAASGTPWATPFTFTSPADTNLTASTEFNDWLYTGATKTWLTGAITTERAIKIGPNTLAFAAGSTVTNAAVMDFTGGTVAGTSATITNNSVIRVESASVGAGSTNSFGLNVSAQSAAATSNSAATFNGAVGIASSANFVPTSVLFTISDAAATTTPIADITHITSVIGNAGALLKLSSASADTGTTTGNLLDAVSTGSVAGTLASIRATNTSQTTETALEVKQTTTTTGYTGNFVSFTGSFSGAGGGNLFSLTCVNTTVGSCESITSNSLTSGTAFVVPHTTSAIITGGSLMRLSSTSTDTGSTTGNLLDMSSSASTTGNLVMIAASGASQTSGSAFVATQSGTTTGYTGDFVSLVGSFSGAGGGDLLGLTCVNTTAGSCQKITSNSVTTGTALTIPHTGSVLSGAGSLFRVSSTSVDTSTTNGSLADFSSTAAVASNLVNIAASAAAQTSGTALNVVQTATTTGYTGNFVSFTGSFSGAGGGNLLGLTCVNTTAGSCESITSNSLTTGTAFTIPHTSSILSSTGSLMALSSTSVDTSFASAGSLLDLNATASTDSVLLKIRASAAAQVTERALEVTQSGVGAGYTGTLVNFTGSSTTGTGSVLSVTGANTTAGNALLVTATSATTTPATVAKISGTGITSGTDLSILGSAPATMTSAGKFLRINDGTTDVFAVGYDGHIAAQTTTAAVVTSSGGSAITCVNGNNAGTCSDARGQMRVTTSVSTNTIVLTFHSAYLAAPTCVLYPANGAAVTDFTQGTILPTTNVTTTAITITPATNWAATAKQINYICME